MSLEAFLKTSKGPRLPRDRFPDKDSPNYWRGVVESEKRRCEEAVDENDSLKARLAHNDEVLQSVNEQLELVKMTQGDIFKVNAWQARVGAGLHDRFMSSIALDLLGNRMMERLPDLDNIYLDNFVCIPQLDVDQAHVRQRSDSDSNAALEIKCTRLVPYAAASTSEVAWNVIKVAMSRGECNIVRQTENMIASEGRITIALEDKVVAKLRVSYIMKRFAVAGAVIVVVEGIIEWQGQSDEWGIVTRESGWLTVHSVDYDGSPPGVSQLQTGLRVSEDEQGGNLYSVSSKPRPLLSRTVSEVIILSYREMLKARHQILEYKLLQNSSL